MQVAKRLNEQGVYDISIQEENKVFQMIFGGNLDLYWLIYNNDDHSTEQEFFITKENYVLYEAFEKLFYNIENVNIYKPSKFYLETSEIENIFDKMNDDLKDSRQYNYLYRNGEITWISDDSLISDEDGYNAVTITKGQDYFKLVFVLKENSIFKNHAVRFRNSGSYYDPFNILFMQLFNELQDYDPEYHQIHLEEYAYQKQIKL